MSTASDDQRAPRQLSVGLLVHKWYTTIPNAEGTVHSAHPTGRRWSPHLELVSVRPRMLLAASLLCHCLCTKYILRMSIGCDSRHGAILVHRQKQRASRVRTVSAHAPPVRPFGVVCSSVLYHYLSNKLHRVLLQGRSGTVLRAWHHAHEARQLRRARCQERFTVRYRRQWFWQNETKRTTSRMMHRHD